MFEKKKKNLSRKDKKLADRNFHLVKIYYFHIALTRPLILNSDNRYL